MLKRRTSIVQMRFDEAAKHPIARIWCGVNQVAQREFEALCNNTFVSILTGLSRTFAASRISTTR